MHKKVEIKSGPKSAKELFDAKERGEMLNFDTDKGKVEASIEKSPTSLEVTGSGG